MCEEEKIIDLENEISFLKDALCEKQKEIEKYEKQIERLKYDREFLYGVIDELKEDQV